ncbi:MAG: FMN-binding protein [Acidobacteria bacterium]|jgi:Na+-translocating ferredoxin:NAD+ oxidoreductase RnfG subunit|nr:MAG: FMN-binding protein [Acidobacteriota bacterium]
MCRRCLTVVILLLGFTLALSREFKKPEQALLQIYKKAQLEVKKIVLSQEQVQEVQRLSGVRIDKKEVSWYIVKKGSQTIAYGFVDTHVVRTRTEVVLYTITPEGKLDVVEVLAFNEPLEYMSEDQWLKLFAGKQLNKDPLKLKRDIPNITGATLTARAITDNARKVLALWQVLFGR